MSQPTTKAPGYIEAFRRQMTEDAFIVIAAELLEDAAAIQAMQRLGVYERMVNLARAVLHQRAHPATAHEAEARDDLRRLPIAERPAPFDVITKPPRGRAFEN